MARSVNRNVRKRLTITLKKVDSFPERVDTHMLYIIYNREIGADSPLPPKAQGAEIWKYGIMELWKMEDGRWKMEDGKKIFRCK